MAFTKISELTDVTSVATTDVIPVVNESETKKISVQQLLDTVKENVTMLNIKIVASTDEVTAENILYLIQNEDEDDSNIYNEYMLINGSVELVGGTKVDLSSYYTKGDINNLLPRILGVQMSGYLTHDTTYNFSATDITNFDIARTAQAAMGANHRIPYILYFGGTSNYGYADSIAVCKYTGVSNSSDGTNWYKYKCIVYRDHSDAHVLEEREMTVVINRTTGLVVKGTIGGETPLRILTPSDTANSLSLVNKAYVDTAISNAITTALEGEY